MLGLQSLGKRIFGSANDRALHRYERWVEDVNDWEKEIQSLDDSELQARLKSYREEIAQGRALQELLPPVFAIAREAAQRAIGQRPFDAQILGGMVLHEGAIAEMKTGEGKTLAATLPATLNALSGKGVHIVTVNDYLAKRDAEWMGLIYERLGLKTGCILHGMEDEARREAYAADITYGTNNELGFDYLRDNMKYRLSEMVQRGHNFSIVDEVDSILIDEARTPLVISGALEDKSELYTKIDTIIPELSEKDYEKDEKNRSATLTEEGHETIERLLRERDLLEGGLYDTENVSVVHHVNQALRAHVLFQRDKDYILREGKVVIIDEFTGRMMQGRRYSEGLHQALEAKENVSIEPENQTLAAITFQNYFRLYEKLSGMTGTALTEAEEFGEIYGLAVMEIPTNLPMIRDDRDDEIYRTAEEKYEAIVEQIILCHERGQPVLVGTVSIEKSEYLSELLKKKNIRHQVLNARYHEQEAHIVAQAGEVGAVTIATNMAGRGTDIQLGGNLEMRLEDKMKEISQESQRETLAARLQDEHQKAKARVLEEGGLFILGTERHESRRIDNQLRGRSGRQGDPGVSKFFLSLDDDLMRIFGTDRMAGMLQKLGLRDGEAIMHPWVNKALEKAQMRVEGHHFDIRKNLLKYDNVMNDQRHIVFAQRLEMISGKEVEETADDMPAQVIEEMVAKHIPERAYIEEWDVEGLREDSSSLLGFDLPIAGWAEEEGIADEEMITRIKAALQKHLGEQQARAGDEVMGEIKKTIILQSLDEHWREHLRRLEHLRQVIGLRGYGQRDPLNEYKTESFSLFEGMLGEIRQDVTRHLARLEIRRAEEMPELPSSQALPEMTLHHAEAENASAPPEAPTPQPARPLPTRAQGWGKVGRNAPCPCGSGKKYKQCHGRN